MTEEVTVSTLLEAGAHFGHRVSHWNPKMRPYIFATKGGIHILDLQQTIEQLKKACAIVTSLTSAGGCVLFVGTKRQAQAIVQTEAIRAQQYYVTTRWLGGMLTNYKTIKASIDRLKDLQKRKESDDFAKLVKKERLQMEREIEKLDKVLSGIKEMSGLPACLFIVDPKQEKIAVLEAKKLKIPVIAVGDSNCDPDQIDYLIAANDDALRSIQVLTQAIADACLIGAERRQAMLGKESAEKEVAPKKALSAEIESKAPAKEKEIHGRGRAFIGGKNPRDGIVKEVLPAEELEKYSKAQVTEELK